jgi:hypothetical protein
MVVSCPTEVEEEALDSCDTICSTNPRSIAIINDASRHSLKAMKNIGTENKFFAIPSATER